MSWRRQKTYSVSWRVSAVVHSGPVLALALVKERAVEHWRNNLGPKDPIQAKNEQPDR